jgi:heme/copper-type cytochrome/quinol oxidase subunit 2
MQSRNKKLDLFFLVLLAIVLAGVPFGISYYNHYASSQHLPAEAKMHTLTGHSERGWLIGKVTAVDAISFWQKRGQPVQKPVIEVKKDDVVVLKLMSSDVVHGFSLKDFGVFLTDGIQPGKAVYVSFKADKVGTFTFSCNAICGDIHQNMQGTLVVKA